MLARQWPCWALLLLVLTWPELSATQETLIDVNLINPVIIDARQVEPQNCTPRDCLFLLRTRATDYFLVHKDSGQALTGKIQRIHAWKQPPYAADQEYFLIDNRERTYQEQRNLAQGFVNGVKGQKLSLMNDITKAGWLQCQVQHTVQLNETTVNICVRDNQLLTYDAGNYTHDRFERYVKFKDRADLFGYWMPLSAGILNYHELRNDSNIDWYLYDITGRMLHTTWKFELVPKGEKGKDGKELEISWGSVEVYHLSPLMNPFSNQKIPAPKSWAKESNYIESKKDLVELAGKDLKTKMRLTYLQAITRWPAEAGGNGGYCIASGYKLIRSQPDNFNDLRCIWQESTSIGIFPIQYTVAPYSITHAALIVANGTHIHTHQVTEYHNDKEDPKLRYIFCTTTKTEKANLTCTPFDINLAPNDFVEFKSDQCGSKAISFFDSVYTLHNSNEPLTNPVKERGVVNSISFYIMAATTKGSKFYFFTHANDIVQMQGELGENCQTLSLKAEPTLYRSALEFVVLRSGLSTELLINDIYDYQEYEKDDTQAKPRLLSLPWTPATIPASSPAPAAAKGSNMMPIIFILIALIVAVIGGILMYFVLCKSKPRERQNGLPIARPKSKRSDGMQALSGIKTVRSGGHPGDSLQPVGSGGLKKKQSKISTTKSNRSDSQTKSPKPSAQRQIPPGSPTSPRSAKTVRSPSVTIVDKTKSKISPTKSKRSDSQTKSPTPSAQRSSKIASSPKSVKSLKLTRSPGSAKKNSNFQIPPGSPTSPRSAKTVRSPSVTIVDKTKSKTSPTKSPSVQKVPT